MNCLRFIILYYGLFYCMFLQKPQYTHCHFILPYDCIPKNIIGIPRKVTAINFLHLLHIYGDGSQPRPRQKQPPQSKFKLPNMQNLFTSDQAGCKSLSCLMAKNPHMHICYCK